MSETTVRTRRGSMHVLRRKEAAWGYLFVLPIVLGVYLFSIGPIAFSFGMSLTNWDIMTTPSFVGLSNYQKLLGNQEMWTEMRNTLYYAGCSVPISLVLSVLLANALNREIPCRGLFRTIYFLPTVTMPVAIALVWKWLFNSQYGLINIVLNNIGVKGPMWLGDTSWIMPAIIIVTIWSNVGYNMIILLAALQNVSDSFYEAASIEGASEWTKFSRITLPLISPTIFFLCVMMIMNALKAFDIIYMFAGGAEFSQGPLLSATRTMVYGIYEKAFVFMQMGYASAESVILFAIILAITGLQFGLQKRWVNYD